MDEALRPLDGSVQCDQIAEEARLSAMPTKRLIERFQSFQNTGIAMRNQRALPICFI